MSSSATVTRAAGTPAPRRGYNRCTTITIDLQPEETARLTAEARRHGLSLEEYVRGRLSPDPSPAERPRKHKITELRGLGKELWQGVDVRQYLDELRDDRDYEHLQGGSDAHTSTE